MEDASAEDCCFLFVLQFMQTLSFFGEDPTEMSTDEFFGIFSTFLQSFSVSSTQLHGTL